MVIESEGARRSIPAEQPKFDTIPTAEPRQAQASRQIKAKAVRTEPAASHAQVHGQALQHPAHKAAPDKLSQGAPIAAAENSQSEADGSIRSLRRTCEKASPGPVQKEQQAGAGLTAEQVGSAEAPQGRAAASADAESSQGSFLGKALSGVSAEPSLPGSSQLSTRQAQQIADAAAAGTLPSQHTGDQSMNGRGPHHSAAAAASSASKGLTARTLQPPKTSKYRLTELAGAHSSPEVQYWRRL